MFTFKSLKCPVAESKTSDVSRKRIEILGIRPLVWCAGVSLVKFLVRPPSAPSHPLSMVLICSLLQRVTRNPGKLGSSPTTGQKQQDPKGSRLRVLLVLSWEPQRDPKAFCFEPSSAWATLSLSALPSSPSVLRAHRDHEGPVAGPSKGPGPWTQLDPSFRPTVCATWTMTLTFLGSVFSCE